MNTVLNPWMDLLGWSVAFVYNRLAKPARLA